MYSTFSIVQRNSTLLGLKDLVEMSAPLGNEWTVLQRCTCYQRSLVKVLRKANERVCTTVHSSERFDFISLGEFVNCIKMCVPSSSVLIGLLIRLQLQRQGSICFKDAVDQNGNNDTRARIGSNLFHATHTCKATNIKTS